MCSYITAFRKQKTTHLAYVSPGEISGASRRAAPPPDPMSYHRRGDRLLAAGRVPRRAAVITFDDGYADNYTFGLPLLKEFDVSATVFLATGALGKDREFWWDGWRKHFFVPDGCQRYSRLRVGSTLRRITLGQQQL